MSSYNRPAAGMDAELQKILRDYVTLERCTGRDEYDAPRYEAGVQVACYIENARRLVISKEGLTVYSKAWLTFSGDPGTTVDDRITLPDGVVVSVLESEVIKDELGHAYVTTVVVA